MYRHHNRQGADIVLEAPKHDPLIKWPTWGHVTVWKIYISIFMRFIPNKFGRLLTLGRIFITQMLKSSPTSCSPLPYTGWANYEPLVKETLSLKKSDKTLAEKEGTKWLCYRSLQVKRIQEEIMIVVSSLHVASNQRLTSPINNKRCHIKQLRRNVCN